jgi:hypothetical protein
VSYHKRGSLNAGSYPLGGFEYAFTADLREYNHKFLAAVPGKQRVAF